MSKFVSKKSIENNLNFVWMVIFCPPDFGLHFAHLRKPKSSLPNAGSIDAGGTQQLAGPQGIPGF